MYILCFTTEMLVLTSLSGVSNKRPVDRNRPTRGSNLACKLLIKWEKMSNSLQSNGRNTTLSRDISAAAMKYSKLVSKLHCQREFIKTCIVQQLYETFF